MLNSFFSRLLTSKLGVEKKAAAMTAAKPLRMQMVYGSTSHHLLHATQLDISKNAKSAPAASSGKSIRERQKEFLLKQGYRIEEGELDEKNELIGFSRSRLLAGGVKLYARGTPYTEDWEWVKKEAMDDKKDIILLSPKRDRTPCLKLIGRNELACQYLLAPGDVYMLPREPLLRYREPASTMNNRNIFKK